MVAGLSTAPQVCPGCRAQLLPATTGDCPACGLAQAVRLAGVIGRLDHGLVTAERARTDLTRYLADTCLPAQRPAATPTPAPPPPAQLMPQATKSPAKPKPRPVATVYPKHPAPVRPARRRRPRRQLSPQTTLLALGVLLLLAAGATFLAVTWTTLPLGAQAAIMGTLAVVALAAATLASRHRLGGTAEAMAVLGFGLLAVDLYAARAKGLIPAGTDGLTYASLACAGLAVVCVLMRRVAPSVLTFGLAAVLAGQLPVTMLLIDRVDVAGVFAALLVQAVATLAVTRRCADPIRLTAAACAVAAQGVATVGALVRALGAGSSWLPDARWHALAAGVVVMLAAVNGGAVLRLRWITFGTTRGDDGYRLAHCVCAVVGAIGLAATFDRLPAGHWLLIALLTAGALAELMLTPVRRRPVLRLAVATGLITLTGCEVVAATAAADARRLALLALLTGVVAGVALLRDRLNERVAVAAMVTGPVAAVWIAAAGELVGYGTASIVLALVAAGSVACAGTRRALPAEAAALVPGAVALISAVGFAQVIGSLTGVAVALAIAAAPLLAYGRRPGRRVGLLAGTALLSVANLCFVAGAGYQTVELYTLPPAVLMVLVGLQGWRRNSSWVSVGPGLLLGLLPSALIAGDDQSVLRLAFVVAAAVALVLIGVRARVQAPFVIGAGVLAKVGVWQFLDIAPLVPRWITLGVAGAILLAAGADYERRITQAKRAVRWVAELG